MKCRNLIKYTAPVAAVIAPSWAFAQDSAIVTAATDALTAGTTDVTSVAALVCGIVALVAVAGIVFGMLRKG